jgi:ubiquinone/menaquinone biosynthesis C-methylase UbiE
MSTDKSTVDSYNNNAYLWAGKMRSGKNYGHVYLEKPAMVSKLPDLQAKTVLCLGCGSGEETEILQDKGADRITGIDISEKLIEIAKNTYPEIEFHTMDMERLTFKDNSFDYVYSSLTLHYVEDWAKTLDEVFRVLKPGGTFLFSTHHPLKWGAETILRDGATLQIIGTEKSVDKQSHRAYGDYLSVTRRETTWFDKLKIVYYNRPISDMFHGLKNAGFEIIDMLEPKPLEEVKEHDRRFWDLYTRIPMFIVWEVRKP